MLRLLDLVGRVLPGIPVCALLLLQTAASGSSAEPSPDTWTLSSVDSARIAAAELIAVGEVVSVTPESTVVFRPQMNFGKATKRVQVVTLSVEELIKGSCGDTLMFWRTKWGRGTLGRSRLLPDSTRYFQGERAIVLLETPRPDGGRVHAGGTYKFPFPDSNGERSVELGRLIERTVRATHEGPQLTELVERAPLVVQGTVLSQKWETVHPTSDPVGTILPYAVFGISEVIKGTPPEDILRIRQNTDKDFGWQDPVLVKGEELVLFLRPGERGRFEIVGRFWGAVPPEVVRSALEPAGAGE